MSGLVACELYVRLYRASGSLVRYIGIHSSSGSLVGTNAHGHSIVLSPPRNTILLHFPAVRLRVGCGRGPRGSPGGLPVRATA